MITCSYDSIFMTNQLLVTGLPLTVSGQQLAEWARKVAPVSEAHVFVDSVTSRSKGAGLVTFESVNDAAQAVTELRTSPLAGKEVISEIATPAVLASVAGSKV